MQCENKGKIDASGQQAESACAGCDSVLAGVAGCQKGIWLTPELQFAPARDAMVRLINASSTMTFDEKQMLRANLAEIAASFDKLTGADRHFSDLYEVGKGDGFRIGGAAQ